MRIRVIRGSLPISYHLEFFFLATAFFATAFFAAGLAGFSGGRTDLAAPETAPTAAPEAASPRTSFVPGPPAATGEPARARGCPVTAVGSDATDCAAPVIAPTTAPATMVSMTSPVFPRMVFTARLGVPFELVLAFGLAFEVAEAAADFEGFDELGLALDEAAAFLRSAAGFGEAAVDRDAAAARPFDGEDEEDDDEGLVEASALVEPPAGDLRAAAFFLVVAMSDSVADSGFERWG